METEFDLKIPWKEFQNLSTVGQVVEYVEDRLAHPERNQPPPQDHGARESRGVF